LSKTEKQKMLAGRSTAVDHPRDAETRASGLEFGRPERIGCDFWIGAGSVVTREVAAGETVTGNPARPRRPKP
jgi:maltose O-acetyltransferase